MYARTAPEQAEPLVAVVAGEQEARDLEAEVTLRHPGARVLWETHPVVRRRSGAAGDPSRDPEPDPGSAPAAVGADGAGHQQEVEVHLVLLLAGGTSGMSGSGGTEDGEASDPVGVAVFADRGDAERDLEVRRVQGAGEDHVVRSLPLGWRRRGWPFTGTKPEDGPTDPQPGSR